jgi:RNA polymerase sigma-70 factor (ECF subfamily)
MNPDVTRASLLSRLRDPGNESAWVEFDSRYRTLLVRFCMSQGLNHADAEDVAQLVTTNMVKYLPRFVYDPGRGRFRDYLFRCARHGISSWRSLNGRRGALDLDMSREGVAGVESDPASTKAWEHEWIAHHYRRAIEAVRTEVEARTLEVFERSVAGESPAMIAREMGMSDAAVYKSRARVKDRMQAIIAQQVREEDDAGEG